MRVLPILFNTDMVRAILDGRKTVTRRLPAKRIEDKWLEYEEWVGMVAPPGSTSLTEKQFYEQYPPYQPGDILYVRETWQYLFELDGNEQIIEGTGKYYYAATDTIPFYTYVDSMRVTHERVPWKPSIHMPKEAARIFLKVNNVRVERLQGITEEQTEAEGFQFTPPCLSQVSEDSYCDLDGPCTSKVKYCDMSAGELFGKVLWDSTIKKSDIYTYGWNNNPWVWVIEFERCEKPENF